MLPAYVALALLLGAAGGIVVNGEPLNRASWQVVLGSVITAMVVVAAVAQLLGGIDSYAKLSDDHSSRDYAAALFEQAPADSLILSNWHWATPLWYLQEVEGARPDVEVRYVFPEGEPYAQTWARRVADGLDDGRDIIATNFNSEMFASLPVAEPIGDAFLFRQTPQMQLPGTFVELQQTLGGRIQVLGYQIENRELSLVEEIVLTLAWKPTGAEDSPATIFAHLVGEDGKLYGQVDQLAKANEEGITQTELRIVPFVGSRPGRYSVQLGAYDQEPLLTGDRDPRFPTSSVQLSAAEFAPATKNPLTRDLIDDHHTRLIGYDWDHTISGHKRLYLHWQEASGYFSEVHENGPPSLPPFVGPWGIASSRWQSLASSDQKYYVPLGNGIVWSGDGLDELNEFSPGQDLVLNQQFLSSRPLLRDLVVSVRLIGFEEGGFHWAWWDLNDAIPAMGAIPTLKWISGSRVSSPHFVSVDKSAAPGQEIGGALTLYDAFTGRVLPILDDRLVSEYGWVPLGESRTARSE
jgi:hypothetical protein